MANFTYIQLHTYIYHGSVQESTKKEFINKIGKPAPQNPRSRGSFVYGHSVYFGSYNQWRRVVRTRDEGIRDTAVQKTMPVLFLELPWKSALSVFQFPFLILKFHYKQTYQREQT